MKIIIISAMTTNKVIGLNNKLPWKIKEELQYFRKVTLNKPIIMGSNTFISLQYKPLKDRYNIVLTHKINKFHAVMQDLNINIDHKNLIFIDNIQGSLNKAKEFYINNYRKELKDNLCYDYNIPVLDYSEEVFIIGGREIYLQFLPFATQLYLSIIKFNYFGNVFFPEIDFNQWSLIASEEYEAFTAKIFERK